jgi:hypothetical protein
MQQALDRLDRLADAQGMVDALSVALGTGPARITLRRDRTTIVARVDRFGAAALRARYRADHAAERRRRSLARALRCRFVRDVVAQHRERVAATTVWLAETRAARQGQR